MCLGQLVFTPKICYMERIQIGHISQYDCKIRDGLNNIPVGNFYTLNAVWSVGITPESRLLEEQLC